jgi:hypothetical protein
MPPKKKEKTALEKMSDRKLLREIRKDLHTLVLQAEASSAPAKPKKRKG